MKQSDIKSTVCPTFGVYPLDQRTGGQMTTDKQITVPGGNEQLYLDIETRTKLWIYSHDTGLSRGEILREALKEYLSTRVKEGKR